jgi:hypothetical protein
MALNGEQVRTEKKAVVVYLKALTGTRLQLPRKPIKYLSQDGWKSVI